MTVHLNLEAEKGYLASALAIPGYVTDHPLSPEMFMFPAHATLQTAILELDQRGDEIGLMTIAAHLNDLGKYSDQVSEALRGIDTAGAVGLGYASQVVSAARRRHIAGAAQRLLAGLSDPTTDLDQITAQAVEGFELPGMESALVSTARDLLGGACEAVLSREGQGARPVRLTTGHHDLDLATGGFRAGAIWVFGALSQWGKSSYSLMVLDLNLAMGRKVLIVSAEDSKDMWGARWLQYQMKIDRVRFDRGDLNAQEKKRAIELAAAGRPEPVFLDAVGKGVDQVAAEVRRLIRRHGIELVIVDYLGAMVTEKTSGDDQRLRINYVARTLTTVIKREKAAGVLFSQITPGADRGMYALRDSKDIANAAEVVAMGIWEGKERSIKLAKNKPGPVPAGMSYDCVTDRSLQMFRPVGPVVDERDFSQPIGGI